MEKFKNSMVKSIVEQCIEEDKKKLAELEIEIQSIPSKIAEINERIKLAKMEREERNQRMAEFGYQEVMKKEKIEIKGYKVDPHSVYVDTYYYEKIKLPLSEKLKKVIKKQTKTLTTFTSEFIKSEGEAQTQVQKDLVNLQEDIKAYEKYLKSLQDKYKKLKEKMQDQEKYIAEYEKQAISYVEKLLTQETEQTKISDIIKLWDPEKEGTVEKIGEGVTVYYTKFGPIVRIKYGEKIDNPEVGDKYNKSLIYGFLDSRMIKETPILGPIDTSLINNEGKCAIKYYELKSHSEIDYISKYAPTDATREVDWGKGIVKGDTLERSDAMELPFGNEQIEQSYGETNRNIYKAFREAITLCKQNMQKNMGIEK